MPGKWRGKRATRGEEKGDGWLKQQHVRCEQMMKREERRGRCVMLCERAGTCGGRAGCGGGAVAYGEVSGVG